jgi:hypothetical protein
MRGRCQDGEQLFHSRSELRYILSVALMEFPEDEAESSLVAALSVDEPFEFAKVQFDVWPHVV